MSSYNIEAHPYSPKSQQGGMVSTSPITTIRKGRLNARAACTPNELREYMGAIIVAQKSDVFRLGCVGIPNGCDKASLDELSKEMQAKQRSLNAFIKQQRGHWPISTTFYTSLQLAYRTKNLSDLENYLNVLEVIKSNYQRDMGGEALLEIEAVKVELLLKLGRYGEALDTTNNALIHWPHDEFMLYSKAQALIQRPDYSFWFFGTSKCMDLEDAQSILKEFGGATENVALYQAKHDLTWAQYYCKLAEQASVPADKAECYRMAEASARRLQSGSIYEAEVMAVCNQCGVENTHSEKSLLSCR
jgi:tetratricopeptide (TPR) repeat protein